jgi:CRISPR-associated endonuclease/helicase Cas3
MDVITSTVVPRHGVARNAQGLSTMQAALLDATGSVTMASAPTGAGKSYVYRRAVQRNERVLFVVPTRRLAQNQAAALRDDLRRDGWPEADVMGKIDIWTGDEAAALREQGVNVRRRRLSGLPNLRYGERGEIIFTTPETLSGLLFNPILSEGLGDAGPEMLMGSLDRIVFDEFHLIQARGFGLVSLCAGLAVNGPWGRESTDGAARAKVSLLSATPVDIGPVMRRLGISVSQDSVIAERLVDAEKLCTEDRMLHGDVAVTFARADSPLDLLREMQADIAVLPAGQSAVVLYDALKDLQRDVPGLKGVAEALGLLAQDAFLVDSSIDAQRDAPWCGRNKTLDNRRLIAATSTIEVGVTIPGLSLMIMDPGFSPLSFMQRLGRVARGGMTGRVIVRVGANMASERPWLKRLLDKVAASGGSLSIQDLSAFMAETARVADRFRLPESEDVEAFWNSGEAAEDVDFFAAMPMRAAMAAGVTWMLLEDRLREWKLHSKANAIREAAPGVARVARRWLEEISDGPLGREGGRPWRKAFESQARILRDFSPTVTVIGVDGQRFDVSEAWIFRHTTLLDQFPRTVDETGRTLLHVDEDLAWSDVLRQSGPPSVYTRNAMLPYRQSLVPLGRAPVEEFARAVGGLKVDLGGAKLRAAKTAVRLVEATGVIPYVDDGLGSSGAGSGVL